jgi:hypothetical protein
MKQILLIPFLMGILYTNAQDETVKKLQADAARNIKKDETDTVPHVWRKGGVLNVNVSQSSLTNWAAGGEDFSIALNTLVSAYAFYKKTSIAGTIPLISTWDS